MKRLSYFMVMVCFIFFSGLTSCSSDNNDSSDPIARVQLTATGSDFDGDVIGNGGSLSKSYEWSNPLNTVDFNMDITASISGSFQLIIKDANGVVVLDKTLVSGAGEDSRSGVSAAGEPGVWEVTIVLSNFNGDGSFSISPGN